MYVSTDLNINIITIKVLYKFKKTNTKLFSEILIYIFFKNNNKNTSYTDLYKNYNFIINIINKRRLFGYVLI